MSLKIRLQRKGRKKKPFYQIVAADARAPRDGKFIQKLGIYNPLTVPATIDLDSNAAYDWLMKGAQPTDTVRAILKLKGVYYKKHLQRGVLKGAFDQEAADKMLAEWLDAKSAKIEKRKEATKNALEDRRAKIFGVAPVVEVKVEEVVEETVTEEPIAEQTATEETATEETVAVETATEETATEETATEETVVEETKPEETVAETTENTEKKDA